MKNKWQEALLNLPKETVVNCILCNAAISYENKRFTNYLALPHPYQILNCSDCDLSWLSPRPTITGYAEVYSDQHYFGSGESSPENYQELVSQRLFYYRKRVQWLKYLMRKNTPLSILDYGAATGNFVAVARQEGHLCDGVELSGDARLTAIKTLGIKLLSANESQTLNHGQFDVVHMNHVLEHMPDPIGHLQWCRDVLNKDGLLLIEVPNQFHNDLDRVRRFFRVGGKQKIFNSYSLHHTYFFTPSSMRRLMQKSGFEIVKIRTFNPDQAPLRPLRLRNLILRPWLSLSDWTHSGGNIIEVIAKKLI